MGLIERIPDHIKRLVPYPPGKPIKEVEREYGITGSVKLASNECPLGPSPLAVNAAREALKALNIYPDGSGYYLKRKLSEKHGLHPENFILGNGSNEIIELIARTFIDKGDEVVMGAPAFVVYHIVTDAVGGEKAVVLLKNYVHDLEAMAGKISVRTKVIFVANPNNPTGTIVTGDRMEAFFESVPDNVLIVIDEAYHEYAESFGEYRHVMNHIGKKHNLIVLRTFSKAYGLAGLRVGYGAASKEVIAMMERVRQPFNVNSLALAAAEAALQDEGHIERSVQVNKEGMAFVSDELGRMGLDCVKSHANFILFDTGKDGNEIYEFLLKKGVIVRPMKGYGLPGHLRVTIGLPRENEKFIKALKECLDEHGGVFE